MSTKHRSKHCALEHRVNVIGDILGYRVHVTSFSSATEQCLHNNENSLYYIYSCYSVGSLFRLTNVAHALWLQQSERFRLLLGMRQGGSIVHVKSDVRQLEHLLELVEVDLLQKKTKTISTCCGHDPDPQRIMWFKETPQNDTQTYRTTEQTRHGVT